MALLLGLAGAACSGQLSTSVSTPDGNPDSVVLTPSVGRAPLRRLTRLEYDQSVQDLFGVTGSVTAAWPMEGTTTGFSTDVAGQGATADLVDQMLRTAEAVAASVVSRLSSLQPCALQASGDATACATAFYETYAPLAYRRPLTEDDRAKLRGVVAWALSRGTVVDAIRLSTVALLQSPHFLYRPELGGEEATVGRTRAARLSDHALATRLSLLLTAAPPDAPLREAAASGLLGDLEVLEAQARRLLGTPRGRAQLQRFFAEWLHLGRLDRATKQADLYPDYTPEVREAMKAGFARRVEHVLFDAPSGTYRELLTAPYVFVNALTAPLVGAQATGADLQSLVPEQPRVGVLTDLAMMTGLANSRETSPVARGIFVFEDLLCQAVPPPPPDLNVQPPAPDPTLTTRERFALHRSDPGCAACHQYFDPPGFALEGYDAIGRYRTTENDRPIDTHGSLTVEGVSIPFQGPAELGSLLSGSDVAHLCAARKWFTFGMGRPDGRDDAYSLRALAGLVRERALLDLLVGLVTTPSFTHRALTPVEECTP